MNRILLLFIIIILVAVGGGLLFIKGFGQNKTSGPTSQNQTVSRQISPTSQINTPTPQQNPSPTQKNQTMTVLVQNFAFNPSTLNVKTGSTVTWKNNDSATHQIVSNPNGNDFKSNLLQNGETYSFTFVKSSIYNYHCGIHPSMKGQIIVSD